MNFALLFEQLLNGLQFGVMLFLMAAGLTLVFGIMNFINLAHGSLYMVGAYLTVAATQWTGSYLAGVALGLAGTRVVGMLVEVGALRSSPPAPRGSRDTSTSSPARAIRRIARRSSSSASWSPSRSGTSSRAR